MAARAGRNSCGTRRASAAMSVCSGRSSREPASSLERSSRSTASRLRRSTCARIWAQEHLPGLRVELLVGEQLEEAAEREDRRAQLVRGGRDEALARGVELGQLTAHVVQRARQLPDLVLAVDREAGAEVPCGDAPGAGLHGADPPGQPPRHEEAREQREQACGAAGDQDAAADDRDARLHVAQGAREDRDASDAPPAAVLRVREGERQGDLADPPVRPGLGAARLAAAGRRGLDGGREVQRDVALGGRVGPRLDRDPAVGVPDDQDASPGRRSSRPSRPTSVLQLGLRAHGATARRSAGDVLLGEVRQVGELGVDQPGLQPRQHGDGDERDRGHAIAKKPSGRGGRAASAARG